MFERKHIENIARARDLVREARELIHQSKELVEETKGALASSKQRECKQASKQASKHNWLTRTLAGDVGASMTYA